MKNVILSIQMYKPNTTDDYDSFTFTNCTSSENSIDKSIPTLLIRFPYDLSFFCLKSLILYAKNKTFKN